MCIERYLLVIYHDRDWTLFAKKDAAISGAKFCLSAGIEPRFALLVLIVIIISYPNNFIAPKLAFFYCIM